MFRFRETVKRINPYKPGKPISELKRELDIEGEIIKLASNENPLGPSPRAMRAVRLHVGEINLYPDNACYHLTRTLAEHHGVDPEMLVLDRGSTGVIELIAKLLVDPGDEMIYSAQSFLMYPIMAYTYAAKERVIPLTADYKIDLEGILAAIIEKTKLIYLPNPNNPTGTYHGKAVLEDFIDRVPDHVVLVLDEAYITYAGDLAPDFVSGLEKLKAGRRNLFILRTFSKDYALAGLRVGYGIGDPELVAGLHRVRNPFNVTSLGQLAALASLEDTDHIARSVESNRAGMAQLEKGLRDLGFEPVPSATNFTLFLAGSDERAAELSGALLKRGVIVRPMTAFGLGDHIRVTVGLEWQNDAFLEHLAAVMGE